MSEETTPLKRADVEGAIEQLRAADTLKDGYMEVNGQQIPVTTDAPAEPVAEEPAPPDAGPQVVQTATMEDFEKMARDEPRFMKKFMDGKATPDEVWRKFVLKGRPCFGCGNPKGAIIIRVFMPLDEAWARNPELLAQMTIWAASQGVSSIPTVDFGNPPQPFIRASERVACDNCKVTAERAAARGPSWCVVEIKRGPEMNPLVRVARSIRK